MASNDGQMPHGIARRRSTEMVKELLGMFLGDMKRNAVNIGLITTIEARQR